MNKAEKEQFRLETRAQAMADAASAARFAFKTGRDPVVAVKEAASIARQAADENAERN